MITNQNPNEFRFIANNNVNKNTMQQQFNFNNMNMRENLSGGGLGVGVGVGGDQHIVIKRNVAQTTDIYNKLLDIFPDKEFEIKTILNQYPFQYDVEFFTNHLIEDF